MEYCGMETNEETNDATGQDDDLSRLVDKCEALTINEGRVSEFITLHSIPECRSIKVHKEVLTKYSPVFKAILNAEKDRKVFEFCATNYDVLVEMARYMYSGDIRNIDPVADELAIFADAYAMHELKDICERALGENLGSDNVIGFLRLADRLRMKDLQKVTMEYIVRNMSNALDQPEVHMLPEHIITELWIRLHCDGYSYR